MEAEAQVLDSSRRPSLLIIAQKIGEHIVGEWELMEEQLQREPTSRFSRAAQVVADPQAVVTITISDCSVVSLLYEWFSGMDIFGDLQTNSGRRWKMTLKDVKSLLQAAERFDMSHLIDRAKKQIHLMEKARDKRRALAASANDPKPKHHGLDSLMVQEVLASDHQQSAMEETGDNLASHVPETGRVAADPQAIISRATKAAALTSKSASPVAGNAAVHKSDMTISASPAAISYRAKVAPIANLESVRHGAADRVAANDAPKDPSAVHLPPVDHRAGACTNVATAPPTSELYQIEVKRFQYKLDSLKLEHEVRIRTLEIKEETRRFIKEQDCKAQIAIAQAERDVILLNAIAAKKQKKGLWRGIRQSTDFEPTICARSGSEYLLNARGMPKDATPGNTNEDCQPPTARSANQAQGRVRLTPSVGPEQRHEDQVEINESEVAGVLPRQSGRGIMRAMEKDLDLQSMLQVLSGVDETLYTALQPDAYDANDAGQAANVVNKMANADAKTARSSVSSAIDVAYARVLDKGKGRALRSEASSGSEQC